MDKFLNKISIESSEEEGMKRVVESGEWMIGIKNYKLANDINHFTYLEKHLLTDEAFVLLCGKCTLLIDVSPNNSHDDIQPISMEKGKVYCVNKSIWHNMIMSKDAKVILVENSNTSAANSEMYDLTKEEFKGIQDKLK